MKQFKKTLLAAVLLIVMVFGCVMTAQAATTMADPVMKPVSTSSFTVTWESVPDAASYQLSYYTNKTSQSAAKTIDINNPATTSYTFTGIPKDTVYYVDVKAFDSLDQKIGESYHFSACVAKPGKVTNVKAGNWTAKSVRLTMAKNQYPNTVNGFDYQILSTSGKVVKKGVMKYTSETVSGVSAKQIYKYRVRPRVEVNGKLYTGTWTTKWLIPQPTMNKLKLASNQRIKVSWKKVKGATKYILYGSTSANSGYKKIKTLNGNKNSFIVSKVKGKKLQKYKNYYFKVVACKGSAKSDNSNYAYGYIYTTFK